MDLDINRIIQFKIDINEEIDKYIETISNVQSSKNPEVKPIIINKLVRNTMDYYYKQKNIQQNLKSNSDESTHFSKDDISDNFVCDSDDNYDNYDFDTISQKILGITDSVSEFASAKNFFNSDSLSEELISDNEFENSYVFCHDSSPAADLLQPLGRAPRSGQIVKFKDFVNSDFDIGTESINYDDPTI